MRARRSGAVAAVAGRRLDSPVVTVTVGVLALQGDVREHVHALDVRRRAPPCRCAARASSTRVDALVIPGGESTTIDKLLRAFELFEPVQERLRDGMPAYGSCAGMILLADRVLGGIEGQQTLGGVDVTVRRNAFGRQVDSFETDLAIEGVDGPLHAVFIRAPWVEEVGPAATCRSAAWSPGLPPVGSSRSVRGPCS